ncbi:MAG: hypothetical protein AB1791_18485 [Chloroflexota bacterium]
MDWAAGRLCYGGAGCALGRRVRCPFAAGDCTADRRDGTTTYESGCRDPAAGR